MFYERFLRPILFALSKKDPEAAHELALDLLRWMGQYPWLTNILKRLTYVDNPTLKQEIWGLAFPNPVGLAAGFDKSGTAIRGFEALGFGFIEIGTVTRYPHAGNPRPRVVRLPADQALINWMGFPNDGTDVIAERLSQRPKPSIPLGINIGKSAMAPLDQASGDYCYTLRMLYQYGDYFAINVSSPNTPGLRNLQEKERLSTLLCALMGEASGIAERTGQKRKPLLLKIAPDLDREALDALLETCADYGIDGLIATNTTLSREGLRIVTRETGGLSGKPLFAKTLNIIRYIRKQLPDMPIIGLGGIFNPDDAQKMLGAGANLVQLYTGLIYKGPFLVRAVNHSLAKRFRKVV